MSSSLLSELRKRQVLHLLEQGCETRDIAQRLGLAETTVQRLRQGRIAIEAEEEPGDEDHRQRVWCGRCRCHVYAPCQRCRLRDYQALHGKPARSPAAPVTPRIVPAEAASDPRLALGVAQLGLPVRTVNFLALAGILTVHDLLRRTPQEILRVPNMGPTTLEAVFAALARLGFHRRGARQSQPGSDLGNQPRRAGHGSAGRCKVEDGASSRCGDRRAVTRRGSGSAAAARPPVRRPRTSRRPP